MPRYPLSILILGGTGFIGPHHVMTAWARGHKVSVFSRGRRSTSFPPDVEMLVGDRFDDLRLLEDRHWDAVIDIAAIAPVGVRRLGEALKDRVQHYTLISTVMTYARTKDRIDENSPVLQSSDASLHNTRAPTGWQEYGSLKVLCEREAEIQFSERSLIVRPGVIVGPGDQVDHIAYWFARMERGGEILAPGDPLAPIQFIDARDLAEWVISMVEGGESGVYNATGPTMQLGMCELLGAVRSQFPKPMRLTWVNSKWLGERGIRADNAPFFWVRDPDVADPLELWLSYKVCSRKAHEKGLIHRSLAATIADSLAWFRTLPAERQARPRSGWEWTKEQEMLHAWHVDGG